MKVVRTYTPEQERRREYLIRVIQGEQQALQERIERHLQELYHIESQAKLMCVFDLDDPELSQVREVLSHREDIP